MVVKVFDGDNWIFFDENRSKSPIMPPEFLEIIVTEIIKKNEIPIYEKYLSAVRMILISEYSTGNEQNKSYFEYFKALQNIRYDKY